MAPSLWLGLLALGGLLAGHLVSYFVVAPDAHERAELLADTGHSDHGVFATLALAATFAAVIGLFMQRLRSRSDRHTARPPIALALWAVQTLGFVLLETWERGHGLPGILDLVHEPAFLIGLVAQVVVALVATALVVLIRATVDALLRLFLPVAGRSAPTFTVSVVALARDSLARAAWNLRGPPSPGRLHS